MQLPSGTPAEVIRPKRRVGVARLVFTITRIVAVMLDEDEYNSGRVDKD
jgi:hypothetical protein